MPEAKRDKVIFRADGNSNIGLGHVYRLLALATMLKPEFECTFAIQNPSGSLKNELLTICDSIIELPAADVNPNELAPFITPEAIIVLDGYTFSTEYQAFFKAAGCKVVCIDDIYSYHFVADVVINHAVGIKKEFYSVEPYTKCFFGPDYLLLREQFLHRKKNTGKNFKNLFINMGGADPNNDTCTVLRTIFNYPAFEEINVVIGGAFRYSEELMQLTESDNRVNVFKNLNADDLVGVMERSGIAILPPSTVSLEYATIGGVLFLKQIADNQKDIKKFLLEENLAYNYETDFAGIINKMDPDAFETVLNNQEKVFDGSSDERLKLIFQNLKRTDV